MNKIKFNPRKKGYWESKTIGIESKSGIKYSTIDNPAIIVAQGDLHPLAVDIVDCGDFLSLKLYGLNQRVNKITNYKKDLESIKKLHLRPVGLAEYSYDLQYCKNKLTEEGQYPYGLVNHLCYSGWRTPEVNIHSKIVDEIQLRIYKDYKVVLIQKIITPEGKEIYFIDEGHHYDEIITIGLETSGKEIKKQLTQIKTIKIIQNEEEVYPLASFLTKKDRKNLLSYFFPINTTEAIKGNLIADRVYSYEGFCENTRRIINNFFNYDEETDPRLAIRKKTYLKDWNNSSEGITSLYSLISWVSISDLSAEKHNCLQEKVTQILQNAGLDSILYNFKPDTYKEVAYWARIEDNIICLVPDALSSMLIYNVKTKKRIFAQYKKENKTWNFPVPSLDLITSYMNLDYHHSNYYDYQKRKYLEIIPKTVILGGLTAKELFKGSNVGWILDNVSDEDCKVFNYQLPYYLHNEEYSYEAFLNKDVRKKMIIPITEYFQDNKIGTFALIVLISTGNIMLEQLLKAKLFNLYFAIIESQTTNCHSSSLYDYYHMSFFDLDSKAHKEVTFKELITCSNCSRNSCRWDDFIIHSKGKNLKEIFNLPLNFLRIINERMTIVCEKKFISPDYWVSDKSPNKAIVYKWHRVHCTCNIISYIFPEIKNVDPKNMNRIADFCMEKKVEGLYDNYYETSTTMFDAGRILYLAFGEDLTKKSLQQRLNFIEQSSHYNPQNFKDYLQMRKQLKEIQENHPEDVGIFSEKDFPILPLSATRFIRYFEGMQLGWHRAASKEDFLKYYQGRYYEGRDLNSPIKRITSPTTKELIGISLDFNGEGFLKYLHDETSYWVSIYQNEAKNVQFVEAVKRVQPLEWKDPESNLCIVAPKNIGDIKEEGSTLNHCVSSYIDPIINGTENIMLIRRMDMPECPFYTLEILNDGEIRQVHCYRNGNLTLQGQEKAYEDSQYEVYNKHFDICKFLQKWAAAFPGKIKVASIKSQYMALIAQWK